MSFSASSVSNSELFSQSSLNLIQIEYDEELEKQELEAEKEKFAQMFEAHYNTTSVFIQTVQETAVFKKAKKLRMLKRKLRKLIRSQIIRKRAIESQKQEGSFNETKQFNQFKYYPDYEGKYYYLEGKKNQEIDNLDWKPMPEPIINPDISIISSSSSTQHSTSQSNLNNVNDVDVTKNTNNYSNINNNNNNNQINNNTNNQCEGIVKKAFEQHDPNEQCQRFQHQQQ